MTRTRDRLWTFAEQLGNHFFCKLCERKFRGGILKIRSHLAGNEDGNVPSCPSVTQEARTLALEAIKSQNRKAKSLSHPMASNPLTDIQKINSSETSTKKRQDCLDDSLSKHVPESGNRAEICREGGEMTRKTDRLLVHAEQSGYHCKDKFPGGNLRITSHGAGTNVPKHIETEASAAITPQKKRAKGLSHPSAPMPLTNIQKINTSETSTERGQESSNQAEIRGKGFTEPNLPAPKDKSLRLHFMTSMPSHLFTDAKVQGDQGTAIRVALLNPETKDVVKSGPGSAAKLNLVILGGESEELDPKWDQLESHTISRGSEEGKAILSSDLVVTLEGGEATLGDFTFTQDSSRTRSGKYRLGVKVACQCYAATHIKGAVSEAFTVEDSRGEFVKKHFSLLPSDNVWRLVGVAISGQAHIRLRVAGIVTVKDFVHLLCLNEASLRNIVGDGISNAMWKHTLEHARSHVNVDQKYAYYFDEEKPTGIFFNWCFEPEGLILEGCPRYMESLSGGEKVHLESQCEIAYKNPDQISKYDPFLFDFKFDPSC